MADVSFLSAQSADVFSEQLRKYHPIIAGTAVDIRMQRGGNSSCDNDIPAVKDFLSAISTYGISIVVMGTVALAMVLVIFADTLLHVLRRCPPRVKAHSAFVIGVYPVVAIATYCALIVPRAHLLADAVTQGIFTAGMYQLFCLFVAYCGGEAELVRIVKPTPLNLRVGPCCCWPCCCCLPSLDMTKDHVRNLRIMVLQLPVVQGLIYMILLVMWAERESLYEVNYVYFQPVIIISILIGVWGMTMTIRLLRDTVTEYSLPAKFLVLQFILLLSKLQTLITRIVIWSEVLPCKPPITPAVSANVIYNCLMLGEMVLLAYLARYVYKRKLPDGDVVVYAEPVKPAVNSIEFIDNNRSVISTCPTSNNNSPAVLNLNSDQNDVHTHI